MIITDDVSCGGYAYDSWQVHYVKERMKRIIIYVTNLQCYVDTIGSLTMILRNNYQLAAVDPFVDVCIMHVQFLFN